LAQPQRETLDGGRVAAALDEYDGVGV